MNSQDLIKARKLLNMTQDQLARALGWSDLSSQVSHLENNKKQVTQQTQLAIECLLRREGKLEDYLRLKSEA